VVCGTDEEGIKQMTLNEAIKIMTDEIKSILANNKHTNINFAFNINVSLNLNNF